MNILQYICISNRPLIKVCFLLILALTWTTSYSQIYPDRHTTEGVDGWISCQKSQNPNSSHGQSHWIHYDLGQQRQLFDMHIWNMNHPKYQSSGFKNVIIEISNNGTNWTMIDTFTFPKASTSGMYEGFDGPDLKGISARHVLLTAIDNHGGPCYGLSEIRIYLGDHVNSTFDLAFTGCENDGYFKNLSGGLNFGGTYAGAGVYDNGDETFDFDPEEVGPGVHPITYTYGNTTLETEITVLPCNHRFCPECDDCANGGTLTINNNPIPMGGYKSGTIFSAGQVNSNSDVRFWYRDETILNPGFEVKSSGTFIADVRGCDNNLLANAGFESNFSGWEFGVYTSQASATNSVTNPGYTGTKAAMINVTNAGTASWHVQLFQDDFTIYEGKKYKVSFAAKANSPVDMHFLVTKVSPFTPYLDKWITLTNFWQNYTYTFVAEETLVGGILVSARYGTSTGTYYLDKVKFVEMDE